MSVRFRISGYAGYSVACGDQSKTRIVFAVFDDEETRLAWYLFSSLQGQCGKDAATTPRKFGHHDVPAFNHHTFEKKIGLDGLISKPAGSPATLNMDVTDRHIDCNFSRLKTAAGETVEFTATIQTDSKPSDGGKDIAGTMYFLELVDFSKKAFKLGPQEKKSQSSITGPVK
ncbi:hypothetical protein [Methylocella silvestris]|uniref:Uncharacterized protein n=1 Tax=Methylocella silvestris TaxID=199596 RepID=A0A2J7TH64_METSI|nr:hypothetical protein [Methylocella silvestris]PNG26108.1 hypothetical protein CR492_09645 [Methylocella silvestris]